MTAAPTTAVSDDELRSVLALAHRFAAGRARIDAQREAAQDAATDAIVRAVRDWNPQRGPFKAFAMWLVAHEVKKRLKRRAERHAEQPTVEPITAATHLIASPLPAAGEVPMSHELRDLPPDLRDAVRFYYTDGFDLRECGLLLGCSAETVRARLERAAVMLAPDGATLPTRKKGERHKHRA